MYLTTFSPRGIVATLRDQHGKVIVTQTALNPYEVKPGNLFIGILSDPGASFDSLSHVSLPNQTNSLSHVWTITPTMVNEALATVSLDDVYIPVDGANFLDRTTVGLNYPYIFPQGKLIVQYSGSGDSETKVFLLEPKT